MNYLAIDTSAEYLTVAARVNGKRFCVHKTDCAMKHSTLLMPTVDELLAKNGLSVADFDCFACVVGAGSFTGIRIGIATAKGFALANRKPTLPVTSFDLAAYTVNEQKILALSDALHDTFYACGFENKTILLPPSYLTKEEVKRLISENGYIPCSHAPLGIDGLRTYSPADGLIAAVETKLEKEEFGELSALYIRKSQAEINLEKGLLK